MPDPNTNDIPDPNTAKWVHYLMDKSNAGKWISQIQSDGLGASPNYALSDPVAANVAVMDKKDHYVSVVTSLNTWFGSKVPDATTKFAGPKNRK